MLITKQEKDNTYLYVSIYLFPFSFSFLPPSFWVSWVIVFYYHLGKFVSQGEEGIGGQGQQLEVFRRNAPGAKLVASGLDANPYLQ